MKVKYLALLFSLLLLGLFTYREIETVTKSSYNATLLSTGLSDTMHKPFSVLIQYLLPQHALTKLAGYLGESRQPWLKNHLIRYFLQHYDIDMKAAQLENPYDYPSFNSFFTRQLKPDQRPIAGNPHIASPADGFISQLGKIEQNALLQAKGFYFNLTNLLGGSEKLAAEFQNGQFATIYLSPKDYHRVHMPITGKLRETIFIPGKLFSVNQATAATVPNLFARNERLVCIFDTEIGPMAVILVGAMLVGSIETVWQAQTKANTVTQESFPDGIQLDRGAELGLFKMGSTVIVLFAKDQVEWSPNLQTDSVVRMGQSLGYKNEKG